MTIKPEQTVIGYSPNWRCFKVLTVRGSFVWYAPSAVEMLTAMLKAGDWLEHDLLGWHEVTGLNDATIEAHYTVSSDLNNADKRKVREP